MKTTHAGLGITEKDWDTTVRHLVATLDRFSVPAKEKDEVLTAVSGLKRDSSKSPDDSWACESSRGRNRARRWPEERRALL